MAETNTDEAVPASWWGAFTLDLDQAGRWSIGPTTLWLYRTAQEWRVLHRSQPDPLLDASDRVLPLSADAWEAVEAEGDEDASIDTRRHSFRSTPSSGRLCPVPADRPVVVRPEHPLSIPAGEQVTLYVSTPLWIRIEVGTTELQEVPSHRPSDTWFGPSTREGELCYASRTAGRLRLENLPLRMHRAVTPLRVRNGADEELPLERVQVPTPHLALFFSEERGLWTQLITLHRDKSGEATPINIGTGPPKEVPDATRIQEPRQEAERGLAVTTFRALGTLFGAAS